MGALPHALQPPTVWLPVKNERVQLLCTPTGSDPDLSIGTVTDENGHTGPVCMITANSSRQPLNRTRQCIATQTSRLRSSWSDPLARAGPAALGDSTGTMKTAMNTAKASCHTGRGGLRLYSSRDTFSLMNGSNVGCNNCHCTLNYVLVQYSNSSNEPHAV